MNFKLVLNGLDCANCANKIEVRVRSDLHNIIKNAESVILDEKDKLLENDITDDFSEIEVGDSNE